MRLDAEQRQALRQFRILLADADSDTARLFAGGPAVESARVPCEIARTLGALGMIRTNGDMIEAGEYRLVSHQGLFLFCQQLTPSAGLYYGNDSLALSRLLPPVEGHALDLCAGVGAQALMLAQTAPSVTAVELEPLAEGVFRINAEINGLSERVEYLVGDLFEPVAGRQFDFICSNPPFMPVAPEVRYPLWAAGGPDGLAVVRRVLMGLPEFMAADGQCQVVGAVLGNSEGPDLSSFEELASDAHLGITISCPSCEELGEAMLDSCAATALACECGRDVRQAFRSHYDSLGATHLYYFLLSATHASQPSVYYSDDEVQRVSISAS
jgi:methylase of polypeptide subunit release factors